MSFFSRTGRRSQKQTYFWKIITAVLFFLVLGILGRLYVVHTSELREAESNDNDDVRVQSVVSENGQLSDALRDKVTSIPNDSLGEYAVLIHKEQHRLFLMRDGVEIASYAVAVGRGKGNKEREGDMKTPEGEFVVQQIQDSSVWAHDFKDGKGSVVGAYGPFFIRLETTPWTGIGIHGTHDPTSIGKDITEGCIRLNNDDLLSLAKKMRIGTKVIIQ